MTVEVLKGCCSSREEIHVRPEMVVGPVMQNMLAPLGTLMVNFPRDGLEVGKLVCVVEGSQARRPAEDQRDLRWHFYF